MGATIRTSAANLFFPSRDFPAVAPGRFESRGRRQLAIVALLAIAGCGGYSVERSEGENQASPDAGVVTTPAPAVDDDTPSDDVPVDTDVPNDSADDDEIEPACVGNEDLVFETLSWAPPQVHTPFIDIGPSGKASEFTTTDSESFVGIIAVVPSSGTDHVTQRIWISKCPGGPPLDQTYLFRGQLDNKCDVWGQEPSLRWTQGQAESVVQCELALQTTYYLNHSNEGCNGDNCPIHRNLYHN